MKNNTILFIGLDTHKEFTEVVYGGDQRYSDFTHLGRIPSTKPSIAKLARQLQSKHPSATLHFVYEAGPCGYWIYRYLTSLGHCYYVVAPSLIPKKPGHKIKTDTRDAHELARLLRSGDLDPIYVPEPEDEAIRDLSRSRETTMRELNDARFQLKALLLRNHIRYDGKANWSLKHLRWLTELILPHPAQQIVLQEMLQTVSERIARLKRLDNELAHHVTLWRYYPVVQSIQAMRGIRLLTATGIVAELGDLNRFDDPRKLMSYVGLTPSEHSSGGKRRLSSITKCGNGRARRLLIESAHCYRYPAKVATDLQLHQEGLPKDVIEHAWKAQLRLCRRYQKLLQRGKPYNVIVTAIAREIIAYVWSIARRVVLTKVDPKLRLSRVPA